jgi:transposase
VSAYSQDLRVRVIAACQAREQSQEKIAQRFQVSLSWLKKIWHRQRATGSSAALAHGGGATPKLTPAQTERLRQEVAAQPDATLAELRERSGAPVTPSRICEVLSGLGLPRKKKPARRRAGPSGR